MFIPSKVKTTTQHFPADRLSGEQPAQLEAKRYAEWLARRTAYEQDENVALVYQQHATRIVHVDNREVSIFAPFLPELSALQTVTKTQIVVLCILALLWGISGLLFGLKLIAATLTVLVLMYAVNLFLSFITAVKAVQPRAQERIDDAIVHALEDAQWPPYTILCPLYRESAIVPQFVQAIQALNYPTEKLQVLFLTEANDHETRGTLQALNLPAHFQILTVPDGNPRTKPRACNYGLLHATGHYVVIYDAEDIPDPLQLKKAVLTFANHETDVVCVQAKLNCYNSQQNLLTRWYTSDYSMWFDLILPGLQQLGFALPLGGTSNHFLTSALRVLGGWDAYNVTEDCDLGLRLARCRLKTVMLDSTTLEEATSLLKNWLRQRSRWIKGYMQTYLVHMRHPLAMLKEGRYQDFLSLQVIVGNRVGLLFLNPLMWILTGIYIAFNSSVVTFYHAVFPQPILYLGISCLIFGNFFYMYLYLLGCVKEKQYQLMPWALLVPCHWILSSIAALFALWELLVRPHYWQKTVHGAHLQGKRIIVECDKHEIAAHTGQEQATVLSVSEHVFSTSSKVFKPKNAKHTLEVMTARVRQLLQELPSPVASSEQRQSIAQRLYALDRWLIATILTACIMSIAAWWHFFVHHQTVLYSDAYSHMRIARAVFDSTNPGLAQLGTVWLPLPHILMFVLIWNTDLWRTGLAGSIISMLCYVITAPYLYLSAWRLTHNRATSYLGTLVFLLNPNILYLQSTPLTELVCICTATMTFYYFLAWIQEEKAQWLVWSAGCMFLTTLARYEGWALLLALCILIVLVGLQRRYSWKQVRGQFVLFGSLAFFGILLWLLWNQVIFGDFLAFQRGPFSAQAQQLAAVKDGTLYTYHNWWMSLKTYTLDVVETYGPVLCGLAALGLLLFFIQRRGSLEAFACLAFLAIFGFEVFSLYTGQIIIHVPSIMSGNLNKQFLNTRYGSEMAVPVALSLALLVQSGYRLMHRRLRGLMYLALFVTIILQTGGIITQGIITLQDGLYGACRQPHALNMFLLAHYNGGRILEDEVAGDVSLVEAEINFRDIVYEGSDDLWPQALAHPEKMVSWVIDDPRSTASVLHKHLDLQSSTFLAHFTPIFEDPISGLRLYHRKGEPPLPSRSVPDTLSADNNICR